MWRALGWDSCTVGRFLRAGTDTVGQACQVHMFCQMRSRDVEELQQKRKCLWVRSVERMLTRGRRGHRRSGPRRETRVRLPRQVSREYLQGCRQPRGRAERVFRDTCRVPRQSQRVRPRQETHSREDVSCQSQKDKSDRFGSQGPYQVDPNVINKSTYFLLFVLQFGPSLLCGPISRPSRPVFDCGVCWT